MLIAREERAHDIEGTELVDGAEEQPILVVENTSRVRMESAQIPEKPGKNCVFSHRTNGENDSKEITLRNSHEQRPLIHKAGAKRDSHCLENSTPGLVLNNSKVGEDKTMSFSVAKQQRLEEKMTTLDNDHALTPPAQQNSNNPMVNGDIKDDHRNKLMDKLLDKDLHIPMNGICGIDPSELDLMASDGERLSGSKASSPDLLDSETNSDFGKYLEEGETDTALFSDILSGDLRIDPMENGCRKESVSEPPLGINDAQNSRLSDESSFAIAEQRSPNLPAFREPFADRAVVPGAKDAGPGAVIQEKVPISAIRPEPRKAVEQSLYTQYNQQKVAPDLAGRQPAVMNATSATASSWNNENSTGLPTDLRLTSAVTRGSVAASVSAPRTIQLYPNTYSENRTKAVATPGASVYELSGGQSRKAMPAHPQQPPVSPLAKSTPPVSSGNPCPAVTTSAIEDLAQFARDGVPEQPVESSKPYRCRWEACTR